MRITEKYKFKIKELRDSPPDITVGEENWDKLETELSHLENNIKVITDKFNFEDWSNMPGAKYQQSLNDNIYITTLFINGVKKAERKELPQNSQGEYLTVETVYKSNGEIDYTRNMKEYEVGGIWKMEVI